MNTAVDDKRGSGAVIGGWACLGLGVLIMFWSLLLFLLYAPLFLAAFVLGIVAIAQKRTANGIFILLGSVVAPVVFGLGLASVRVAEMQTEIDAKKKEVASQQRVKVGSVTCEEFGGRTRAEVSIANSGSVNLDYGQVFVEFTDAAGKVVSIDNSYLSPTSVPPGSLAKATIYGPGSASKCTVSAIQNSDGQRVPSGD